MMADARTIGAAGAVTGDMMFMDWNLGRAGTGSPNGALSRPPGLDPIRQPSHSRTARRCRHDKSSPAEPRGALRRHVQCPSVLSLEMTLRAFLVGADRHGVLTGERRAVMVERG